MCQLSGLNSGGTAERHFAFHICGSNEQEAKEPSEERRRLLILWAGSLMDGHMYLNNLGGAYL